MPSLHLSELELPSMERAGRQADRAIDRLLGRSRTPSVWPWVAGIIGVTAILGIAAAFLTMNRRPSWSGWQGRSTTGYGDGTMGTTETSVGGTDAGFGGTTTAFGTDPDLPSIQESQP